MKTALPSQSDFYNEKEDVNHTLYCGTVILQARYHGDEYLHAVVIRTGEQFLDSLRSYNIKIRSLLLVEFSPSFQSFLDADWIIVLLDAKRDLIPIA